MALQTVGHRAVAVGILQDVAAMTGLAVGQARQLGVVFVLMASAKIGVIGSVTGDACPTMATVDALVRRLQGACTLRVDMAGAATIAALVVDGDDVLGVVGDVALVMTGDTLGARGDLAKGYMVDVAMG